jgi:hypothetical protein
MGLAARREGDECNPPSLKTLNRRSDLLLPSRRRRSRLVEIVHAKAKPRPSRTAALRSEYIGSRSRAA